MSSMSRELQSNKQDELFGPRRVSAWRLSVASCAHQVRLVLPGVDIFVAVLKYFNACARRDRIALLQSPSPGRLAEGPCETTMVPPPQRSLAATTRVQRAIAGRLLPRRHYTRVHGSLHAQRAILAAGTTRPPHRR